MPARRLAAVSLGLALLAASVLPAQAGPQDTRVGETRVLYAKQGTVLRAEGAATAAPVATLPQMTSVVVEEVKLPWVKVREAASGKTPASGWIRAYEAIEPQALAQTPEPPHLAAAGGAGAQRDVSAAGRQFTSGTERGYRASRADLERGYQAVDRLEAETSAMQAADAISFVMDGNLGRRGHDYLLPPRLTPTPQSYGDGDSGHDVGDTLGKIGGALGRQFGKGRGSERAGEALGRLAGGLGGLHKQLNERFTPEQEYYLGRAVAATAIAKYGVDPDQNRRLYVRRVGDAIVRLADPRIPANIGGYQFEVLDSDEVNGVSGPGGFVLVTRGAVMAARTEDELAGILAHELAHITQKHGETTLRKGKAFQAGMKTFAGAAASLTGLDDNRLTSHLVDLFSTAVGEMSRTAVEHGYGRDLEFAADAEGTALLYEVFYDWTALRTYLARMATDPRLAGGSATHAAPADRAQALDSTVNAYGPYPAPPSIAADRLARFSASLGLRPAPR